MSPTAMPARARTVKKRKSGTLLVVTRSRSPAAAAVSPTATAVVMPTLRAKPTASAPTSPKQSPGSPVIAPAMPALMPSPSRTSSSTGPGEEAPGRRLIETSTTAARRMPNGRAEPPARDGGRGSASGTCTDSREHQQDAEDEGGHDDERLSRCPGRSPGAAPSRRPARRPDHHARRDRGRGRRVAVSAAHASRAPARNGQAVVHQPPSDSDPPGRADRSPRRR